MRIRYFKSFATVMLVVSLLSALLFFQPRWLLELFAAKVPGVVYFNDTTAPIVALTIDDSPHPITTSKILTILSRNQAKATFFVISDRVEGHEPLVWEIVKNGNELGNHLTTHEPSIDLSPMEFEAALLEAHSILSGFGKVRWFRPGSGWYNSEMLRILNKHNYQCVLGSVYPYDALIPSTWFSTWHILMNARPGSIIILHDGGAKGERTISSLETILPELHRRGYRLVTLSEMFEHPPQNID